MRSFVVRIDHGLFELRIAHAPAKLVRQHRALAGGVYDHFGEELFERAVLHLHFNTNRTVAFKKHFPHEHTLVRNHALLGRVVNEQVIEFRACHLPGDGAFVMYRLEEVEGARLLARSIRKLDAVLPYEWTFSQFFEQTQTPEGPVSISHQRLTDVMTWKDFFFEKDYLAPFAREHAGNGTPCGSTTHYYD